jgi:rare lipoprotein A
MKIILLVAMFWASLCQQHEANSTPTKKIGELKKGIASHYSVRTNGGVHTASGIPLSDNKLTAASVVFPLRSMVEVTNLSNGKKVIVKIIDTGPFAMRNGKVIKPLQKHPTRIIDMSQASAKVLGFHQNGVAKVEVRRVY